MFHMIATAVIVAALVLYIIAEVKQEREERSRSLTITHKTEAQCFSTPDSVNTFFIRVQPKKRAHDNVLLELPKHRQQFFWFNSTKRATRADKAAIKQCLEDAVAIRRNVVVVAPNKEMIQGVLNLGAKKYGFKLV